MCRQAWLYAQVTLFVCIDVPPGLALRACDLLCVH
jgi:hypothetical protein